jgi:hypothetical protein
MFHFLYIILDSGRYRYGDWRERRDREREPTREREKQKNEWWLCCINEKI